MREIWKSVVGYEGRYEISNIGRLKSIIYSKHIIMKPYKDRDGYLRVVLSKDNKKKNTSIHRLVAEAFIPNINNLEEVNHKDGNKTNNKVDNLEWSTTQDNITHAVNTGLRNNRGERNANSKLTKDDVEFIRQNYKPRHKEFGAKALAERFGVHRLTISSITNGHYWKEES